MTRTAIASVLICAIAPAQAGSPGPDLLLLNGSKTVVLQNFTALSALPNGFSYSGWATGTGSCVNGSGVVNYPAAPCFDYNPATLAPLGLRIEGARNNYAGNSATLSTSLAYSFVNSSLGTTTTGPDGTSNAYPLIPSVTNAGHLMNSGTSLTGPTTFTMAAYAKASGYNQVALREGDQNGGGAIFTLSGAGTINGYYSPSGETCSNGSITPYPNSWYRISVTCVVTGSIIYTVGVVPLNGTWSSGDPFSVSFAGNGTSAVLITGVELEGLGAAFASSYIPTPIGSSVTRSADNVTLTGSASFAASKGPTILESQNEQTGVISRQCFAPGAFAFPSFIWARKLAIYQPSQSCASLTNAGFLNVNVPLR